MVANNNAPLNVYGIHTMDLVDSVCIFAKMFNYRQFILWIFFCFSSKSIDDWCAFRMWLFPRIQSIIRCVWQLFRRKAHDSRPISLFNASRQSCVNEYGLLHQTCGFTNYGITLAANEREICDRFYNREWNAKHSHCFDPIWFQFNLIYVIAFADAGNFAAFFSVCVGLWKGADLFSFFLITPNGREWSEVYGEPNRSDVFSICCCFTTSLHSILSPIIISLFTYRYCFLPRKLKRIIKRR